MFDLHIKEKQFLKEDSSVVSKVLKLIFYQFTLGF